MKAPVIPRTVLKALQTGCNGRLQITRRPLLATHVINSAASSKKNKTGLCTLSIEEIAERVNRWGGTSYTPKSIEKEIRRLRRRGIIEEPRRGMRRLSDAMKTPLADGIGWERLQLPPGLLKDEELSAVVVLVVTLIGFKWKITVDPDAKDEPSARQRRPWRARDWTAEQLAKELCLGVQTVSRGLKEAERLKLLAAKRPEGGRANQHTKTIRLTQKARTLLDIAKDPVRYSKGPCMIEQRTLIDIAKPAKAFIPKASGVRKKGKKGKKGNANSFHSGVHDQEIPPDGESSRLPVDEEGVPPDSETGQASAWWRPGYLGKLRERFPALHGPADAAAEAAEVDTNDLLLLVAEKLWKIVHGFEWGDGLWTSETERDDWWMRFAALFIGRFVRSPLPSSSRALADLLEGRLEGFRKFIRGKNKESRDWHPRGEPDTVLADFNAHLKTAENDDNLTFGGVRLKCI